MNLPQLNNLIDYVNLMCYANFMCFVYQIPYHFSHSINDYSCILYFHYILQITSYVYDSCLVYPYLFISFYMCHAYIFQRSGYRKGLYVPEGTITICDSDLYLYCDAPKPRDLVDNPSTHGILMGIAYLDTTRSRPIHRDPFMHIYILEKYRNLSKQFIRVRVTTLLYTKYYM